MPESFALNIPAMDWSTVRTRATLRPAAVLSAMISHGLVLAVLTSGMHQPVERAEKGTVKMIMVPAGRPVEPGPERLPLPAAATAMNIDPQVSETPSESPVPMTTPPEAQASVAELSAAAPSAPAPETVVAIPPTETIPSLKSTASKPSRRSSSTGHLITPKGNGQVVSTRPKVMAAVAPAQPAPEVNALDDHRDAEFIDRIRNAVQAAIRCPATARMMGQSGEASVMFDYQNGALDGSPHLAQSSGTAVLDTAALTAVRNAHYPQAPPEASGQVYHLLIWVIEACSD